MLPAGRKLLSESYGGYTINQNDVQEKKPEYKLFL